MCMLNRDAQVRDLLACSISYGAQGWKSEDLGYDHGLAMSQQESPGGLEKHILPLRISNVLISKVKRLG